MNFLCAATAGLLGLAVSFSVVAQSATPKPLRIVVTGDSTVSDYDTAKSGTRGWGMYLKEFFKPGSVEVVNLATSGRSTKTFLSEGRWARALAAKPDYLLIQFGHNDSHDPKNNEATDFATDYKANLRRFIDDARAISATPILVTPMVRRRFDAQGKIADETPPSRPLSAYAKAMREVAAEKKAALIDLHAASLAQAEKLGPAEAAKFANKSGDFTHFNETGARAMAALVVAGLPAADEKLAASLATQPTP